MSKLAEQLMGKTEPDRIPLDLLVNKIVSDLYLVFRGNGFKSIGFTLIAHDTTTGDSAASGNLKPEGIKALLENCLDEMNKVEPPEDKSLPN